MARAKRRGTEAISDMVRSLCVVGVVIVPLWLLVPHHSKQKVNVIQYSTELAQVRRLSSRPLPAPEGLSAHWRATSVAISGTSGHPVTFHLGFLTPQGQYAALEETDGPAAVFLVGLEGKGPSDVGSVPVGRSDWRRLVGADGRTALVAPGGPPTVVVKGTAGVAELTTLAASLR